jgi:hypothetical protein
MPIWLRRYTASSIREFYEKQREAEESAQQEARGIENATPQNTQITRPNIKSPTYSTKASTK